MVYSLMSRMKNILAFRESQKMHFTDQEPEAGYWSGTDGWKSARIERNPQQ